VRFGAGGICGSDLHYYQEGGILDFKVREPLVLGHEVAGEVVEIGPGVTKVSTGHRVAVNPLRACLRCVYCLSGHSNLCSNRRFFGRAARFPHVQGMFAELFIASEEQCVARATACRVTPNGSAHAAMRRRGCRRRRCRPRQYWASLAAVFGRHHSRTSRFPVASPLGKLGECLVHFVSRAGMYPWPPSPLLPCCSSSTSQFHQMRVSLWFSFPKE
jgi:hypothetical protein